MISLQKLAGRGLSTGIIALALSCFHEPFPTCVGVIIKLELTKTDATDGKANGTITVAAMGESKFFTYSINHADFQASNKFTGLDSGKYTINVKNSWGCLSSNDIKITRVDPCAGISLAAQVTNSSPGQSTGSITGMLSGGTGFTYALNNGTFQNNNVFNGLAPGNYTVTAKNTVRCIFTTQATIGTTDPCAGVVVSVTTTTVNPTLSQSNGSITATAAGSAGFTYSLNSGAFQSSGLFSNLGAGNYTITAKSAGGCLGMTQVALGATNPCAGITVVVTTTSVNPTANASNGSITASAAGGTGFTFSINNGAFQSGGVFSNLAAGNYLVTVKNSDGCIGSTQVALGSTNPCTGVTITVTASVTNATVGLSNGSIVAGATGGAGFTFSLNSGAYQSSGSFLNLAAGNYSVVAKNADGCLGSAQFTVGAINPCANITVVVTSTIANATGTQADGSITASATGGSGFTFKINNGVYQAGNSFTGLTAGTYTVTAKNSNGCTGSATFTVGSSDPCVNSTIAVSASSANSNNCVTPGTGSITITATGSTGFTYNLNNGTYQAGAIFNAVAPGTYTVGVKDVNNCTKTSTVVVGTVAAGPTFSALKILVQSRCSGSGCHTNGQSQKGYNFDTDCNIVKAWSGINGSCISGTLTKMPISPQPNLTTAEKQTITDWINAGHGFNN